MTFTKVMLSLAQSLATNAMLLLTGKGWSAVRTAGLSKQEVRMMTGLCVYVAMGDLVVGSSGGDGMSMAIVSFLFRGTLYFYLLAATVRALQVGQPALDRLKGQMEEHGDLVISGSLRVKKERLEGVVWLMQANLIGLVVLVFYSIASWLAAFKWPLWSLLPIILHEIPTTAIYIYIIICIKFDLL